MKDVMDDLMGKDERYSKGDVRMMLEKQGVKKLRFITLSLSASRIISSR
jgi:hypothetical protein